MVLIILMNFLIAVISQSYDSVMDTALQTLYSQRCEMNLEIRLMRNKLGVKIERTMFIISANCTEEENDDW